MLSIFGSVYMVKAYFVYTNNVRSLNCARREQYFEFGKCLRWDETYQKIHHIFSIVKNYKFDIN